MKGVQRGEHRADYRRSCSAGCGGVQHRQKQDGKRGRDRDAVPSECIEDDGSGKGQQRTPHAGTNRNGTVGPPHSLQPLGNGIGAERTETAALAHEVSWRVRSLYSGIREHSATSGQGEGVSVTIPTIAGCGAQKGGYAQSCDAFNRAVSYPRPHNSFPRSIGLGQGPDTPRAAPSVPGKRDHLCPCPVCSPSRASVSGCARDRSGRAARAGPGHHRGHSRRRLRFDRRSPGRRSSVAGQHRDKR